MFASCTFTVTQWRFFGVATVGYNADMTSSFFDRVFRDANLKPVPYDGSPVSWRISAYAIVLRGDSILLVRHQGESFFDVPGGGVELGETVEDAIQREALEEVGARVTVGDQLWLGQDFFYHAKKHAFYQTVQLFYSATVEGELEKPTESRVEFYGWVPVADLAKYPVIPVVEEAIQRAMVASL